MTYYCLHCAETKHLSLCGLCDGWYCQTHSKEHDHPEPQSGLDRDRWLASGLPYREWERTPYGQEWVAVKNGRIRKVM